MRAFALEQLAMDGEEPAGRMRHADAVLAFYARHPAGDGTALAACEAEMENAREAFAFAQAHDLGRAAQLTARVSLAVTFSVWQVEASAWLRSLETLMEQPAGQAIAADVRATWWTELARVLLFRGEKRAKEAARRAVGLWRPLQQPRKALSAAVAWVRSVDEAGPELDEACAELKALVAELPDLPARARLSIHGAFVKAAGDRGDYEAALAGRLEEMALAESLGMHGVADAADTNVVHALLQLGRFAAAAERGEALLARIDARAGSPDSNLPWVFAGLMPALVKLGRLERAQALVARAWKVGQRRSVLVVLPPLAQLAVAQQRFEAAATLIGYMRERFESRAVGYGDSDALLLNEAEAAVKAALGTAAAEPLMQRGRSLGDDAAAALANVGAT
jgi:tetratricopeptide (TPR) repeat protein